MATPLKKRVGARVEESAKAFVQTRASLAQYTILQRDEDSTIGQKDQAPKPSIIIAAADQGRYHRLLPIRNVALSFTVRANSKTPAGNAGSFETLTGELENLLDTSNLVVSLSNSTVSVMLAPRPSGSPERSRGLIREQMFTVDCRVVAAELTTQGAGS